MPGADTTSAIPRSTVDVQHGRRYPRAASHGIVTDATVARISRYRACLKSLGKGCRDRQSGALSLSASMWR